MGSKHKYRTIGIPLFIQAIRLTRAFPASTVRIRQHRLVWDGVLQPSLLSDSYHVRIEYRIGMRPIATVYGDNLQRIDDPALPHHYHVNPQRKQVQMCLHLPGEFNSSMLLVKTILPWASEWLLHYEVWLATGEWYGGGVHPGPRSARKRSRSAS